MMQPLPPNRAADEPLEERPLQLHKDGFTPEGVHDREFLDDLASRESTAEAQRVQRLWDHEVILALQLQGYDTSTPEWVEFASTMASYGYPVLKGWLISGVLYRMAANHGNGRGVRGLAKIPEALQLVPDDAHALAADVVVVAIDQFRSKTLMHPRPEKRWTPTGGASLKTFFIGRCLMEFPDTYVKWHRDERRMRLQTARYADLEDRDPPIDLADPAVTATRSARLDEGFAHEEPLVRVMFELQAEGFTYAEIAEMLTGAGRPTSSAAVRTKMSRLRTTVSKGA